MKENNVHLSSRDAAIVLAALRMGQDNLSRLNFMEHMEDEEHATADEIDDLCYRINCGE